MDEEMDGWMDGWMKRWIRDGWKNGWMDGWMKRWMDRWMDGWMRDGWMEPDQHLQLRFLWFSHDAVREALLVILPVIFCPHVVRAGVTTYGGFNQDTCYGGLRPGFSRPQS